MKKPKKKIKARKVKGWAVINTYQGEFLNICGVWVVRCSAIFKTRKDAVNYKIDHLNNDKELKVVPCEIKILNK